MMKHGFFSEKQDENRSKYEKPSNIYMGEDGQRKRVSEVRSIDNNFDPEQFVKDHKLNDIKYVGIVDASKNLFTLE